MDPDNFKYSDLTSDILRVYYDVYNNLGYGFLEKVYENAMMIELKKQGIPCQRQVPIEVYYDDQSIGHYFADILVDDKIIIELKAAEGLLPEHECQLVNYLKATDIEVGLLLNFGKKPQHKRRVLTAEYKSQYRSLRNK